jgi:DNA-binding MarR family transcriptional regulator
MMYPPLEISGSSMKSHSSSRRGTSRRLPPDEGTQPEVGISLKAMEGAVGYHLRRAQTVVLEDLGRRFRKLGLNPRDFTVMSVIGANPGINASRIAESLPMKRSNLSVLLVRLKRRGLVRRAEGEEFNRIQSLHLTQEGSAMLEQARRLHREHLSFLEGVLGRSEMAQLIRSLRKLGGHMPELT